MKEVTDDELYT